MKGERAGKAAGGSAAERQKMLDVLKQFRILLNSIKRHYQWVERECGLSGAQIWAMAEIADNPGLKVSELAARLADWQMLDTWIVVTAALCAMGCALPGSGPVQFS